MWGQTQPRSVVFSLFIMVTLSVLRCMAEMEVETQRKYKSSSVASLKSNSGQGDRIWTSDWQQAECMLFTFWQLGSEEPRSLDPRELTLPQNENNF